MEESKQQQLILQMQQQQQQLQHRQQQFFMMQQMQKQQQQQQQQQAAMSRFPSNINTHFRPPGFTQNQPVNPSLQNQNQNPNPNLIQQSNNFQQQQQQMMRMMMMQQQQKLMRPPSNQSEIQLAYQDAWRVCHPDFKRPFASLEDACERLLPYHVVADYEAEEDDRLLDADPTGQTLSRCQQWDNNISAKVAEFTATFEKQAQAFNMITQKRSDGELRAEERLMIEQHLLQDQRNAYNEVKLALDRENKAQEARLRMAAFAQATGQVRVAESQQSYNEIMARNPLRANAIGNHGEQQQGRNMKPEEMMMNMMMNGYRKKEDNEPPLEEDFLNDEEHDNWRPSGEFDLNIR